MHGPWQRLMWYSRHGRWSARWPSRMSIVQVIGRLAPGVSLGQVRAELAAIQKRSIETAREAAETRPEPEVEAAPGPAGRVVQHRDLGHEVDPHGEVPALAGERVGG